MILLALVGCGCPSFDETEVTDPDGVADEGFLSAIKDRIAAFAEWTGRDGVCVPEVRVLPEVHARGEEVGGKYSPITHLIEISAGEDPALATTHELCHALDDVEDHSIDHPTLFRADDVEQSDLYPTKVIRETESFARACESGPEAFGPVWDYSRLCNPDHADDQAFYLHDHVFTDAPWPFAEETIDWRIDHGSIAIDGTFAGATTMGGDVAILTFDDAMLWMYLFAPGAPSLVRKVPLVPVDGVVTARLVDGYLLLTTGDGDAGIYDTRLYAVDAATGALRDTGLALAGTLPMSAAASDGIVYVEGVIPNESLTFDVLDPAGGTAGPGAAPAFGWFVPTAGGVVNMTNGAMDRYDRASDSWARQDIPSGDAPWLIDEDHVLYALDTGSGSTPVVYDVAAGEWILGEDPCETIGFGSWYPASAGGKHFRFTQPDDGGPVSWTSLTTN
jgi:hypothetical protein